MEGIERVALESMCLMKRREEEVVFKQDRLIFDVSEYKLSEDSFLEYME